MSPLLSYSLKSLFKNKARTTVTIIGIMMSAALITALASFGTSLYYYMQKNYISKYGDWHLGVINIKNQDVESLLAEADTEEPVLSWSIGYSRIENIDNGKPYLYLQGVEQAYYKHMPVHLSEGRLPEREGEILLPEILRGEADNWQTGSRITLDTGIRIKDKKALWQYIPYGTGADGVSVENGTEELQQLEKQSYKVTGFYKMQDDSSDAPGYEALTWWDGKIKEDNYNRVSIWFKIASTGNKTFHKTYDRLRLVYGYDNKQIYANLNVLSLYGARISDSGESAAIAAVAAILLFIIMAGSVMMIYNAFAISVNERTKQFGLLSSIGATKRQILKSVLYEAVFASVAGVLPGIFAGIAVTGIVLASAGGLLANMMEFTAGPELYICFPAIVLAAVLSVLTVLLSAWIPAKRATKVTAIEAIRQNKETNYSKKQNKVPGLVEKIFGFEGTLAFIYSRRNRKMYRVTTVALFFSIVLFISINTFSSYMMTVIQTEYKTANYDVLVSPGYGQELKENEKQEILDGLRGLESIDSVTETTYLTYKMPLKDNESHITEDFYEILADADGTGKMTAAVSVTDNKSFSDFCKEHGLEEADFLDTSNLSVVVKNNFYTPGKNGNTKLVSGLKEEDGSFYISLVPEGSYTDNGNTKFTAGYFTESLAPGCNDNWNLNIMLPEQVAKELGILNASSTLVPSYCITAKDHRKAEEEAMKFMEAKYPGSTVYDLAEKQAGNRNLVFLLRFLANGFIIMISVISVSNVFSTISSNLKLRQKEFAMLKTVGMTQQGLRRMMNLECLLYGGKAVLYGIPASVLAAAVMYYYFHKDVLFGFYIPLPSVLIAIGSVFMVVFITMLYTMQRIKKENIIDVLKQENF